MSFWQKCNTKVKWLVLIKKYLKLVQVNKTYISWYLWCISVFVFPALPATVMRDFTLPTES